MKLLHISDTHGKFPNLNGYHDHTVILTGDVTDDGSGAQLTAARGALEEHNVIAIPGNHDYGYKGNFYSDDNARKYDELLSLPLTEHAFFDKTPLVRFFPGVTLIGLNSNTKTSNIFDFACGYIGRSQLEALDRSLGQAKGAVVVALHHHPFIHNDPTMKLADAAAFWRVGEGRADIVLFGHKHESDRWSGRYGVPHVLAADSTPESGHAREIIIEDGNITINTVRLEAE